MNIGVFTNANSKGQVVIPKAMRDKLRINEKVTLNIRVANNAIHIYPVSNVNLYSNEDGSYLKLLEKTKGKWGRGLEKNNARQDLEIKASKNRKKAW